MIGAGPKPAVKVHITADSWLAPVVGWRPLITAGLAKNRQWFWAITVGSSQEPTVITSQYKKLTSPSSSSSLPSRAQRRAFGPLPPLLWLLFTMKLALGFGRMGWSSCFKVSNKHIVLWFCCLISVVLIVTLLDSHSSSFSILQSTFPIGLCARLPSKLWWIYHPKGWCLWWFRLESRACEDLLTCGLICDSMLAC
jgi:hypothetical protein